MSVLVRSACPGSWAFPNRKGVRTLNFGEGCTVMVLALITVSAIAIVKAKLLTWLFKEE